MNRSRNKEVKIVKKKNEDSNAKEDVKSVMGVQKKKHQNPLFVCLLGESYKFGACLGWE